MFNTYGGVMDPAKKKKLMIVGALSLALIVIAVLLYVFVLKPKDTTGGGNTGGGNTGAEGGDNVVVPSTDRSKTTCVSTELEKSIGNIWVFDEKTNKCLLWSGPSIDKMYVDATPNYENNFVPNDEYGCKDWCENHESCTGYTDQQGTSPCLFTYSKNPTLSIKYAGKAYLKKLKEPE